MRTASKLPQALGELGRGATGTPAQCMRLVRESDHGPIELRYPRYNSANETSGPESVGVKVTRLAQSQPGPKASRADGSGPQLLGRLSGAAGRGQWRNWLKWACSPRSSRGSRGSAKNWQKVNQVLKPGGVQRSRGDPAGIQSCHPICRAAWNLCIQPARTRRMGCRKKSPKPTQEELDQTQQLVLLLAAINLSA